MSYKVIQEKKCRLDGQRFRNDKVVEGDLMLHTSFLGESLFHVREIVDAPNDHTGFIPVGHHMYSLKNKQLVKDLSILRSFRTYGCLLDENCVFACKMYEEDFQKLIEDRQADALEFSARHSEYLSDRSITAPHKQSQIMVERLSPSMRAVFHGVSSLRNIARYDEPYMERDFRLLIGDKRNLFLDYSLARINKIGMRFASLSEYQLWCKNYGE